MFVGWWALGHPLPLPAATLTGGEKALEGASGDLRGLSGPVPGSCHGTLSEARGPER